MNLEQLVEKATAGDDSALQTIVANIQDNIYYLALRMLFNPEDAKDATQEILIKVITKLSSFEQRSTFKTWVYRVATNHLLNSQKIRNKELGLSFDIYKADLESDLEPPSELEYSSEYPILLNEVRISCTIAMLLCLNQSQRMAYILGDIFELDHNEASEAMQTSKENYRQLLSRARKKVLNFTRASCGLVSDSAKCTCPQKLKGAIRRQRVIPNHLCYVRPQDTEYAVLQKRLFETQEDLRSLKMQTAISPYKSPQDLAQIIKELIE